MGQYKNGVELITKERESHIEEGHDSLHDEQHKEGELAEAAEAYILSALDDDIMSRNVWPWAEEEFNPSTALRDLIKAGALIAAEIDRRLNCGETVG